MPEDKEIAEVKSLINLLDDEDSAIYTVAADRLRSKGDLVLPYLAADNFSGESLRQKRCRILFDEIVSTMAKKEFRRLVYEGVPNLEEAIFVVARQRYPLVEYRPYQEHLASLALELKTKISPLVDPADIIHSVNEFFFTVKGFRGIGSDYYDENNHFIHKILESKIGVPIALSTLYIIVGEKINLPISGIGLPGHFIVQFNYGSGIYYIDPFNAGKILSRTDCRQIVADRGYQFRDEYLVPVTNKQIVERMLRNLILVYDKAGSRHNSEILRQYIDILHSDVYIDE